jgi:hypothetical protein
VKRIYTRRELVALARELKVRPDWHEPDEQDLTARVFGDSFDNATAPGRWYGGSEDEPSRAELHVVLYRKASWSDENGTQDTPLAVINLATLLSWATGNNLCICCTVSAGQGDDGGDVEEDADCPIHGRNTAIEMRRLREQNNYLAEELKAIAEAANVATDMARVNVERAEKLANRAKYALEPPF